VFDPEHKKIEGGLVWQRTTVDSPHEFRERRAALNLRLSANREETIVGRQRILKRCRNPRRDASGIVFNECGQLATLDEHSLRFRFGEDI